MMYFVLKIEAFQKDTDRTVRYQYCHSIPSVLVPVFSNISTMGSFLDFQEAKSVSRLINTDNQSVAGISQHFDSASHILKNKFRISLNCSVVLHFYSSPGDRVVDMEHVTW